MKLTDEQKALVTEHRQLIATFSGDKESADRIQAIEAELKMSTGELGQLAVSDYMKQY